jgi:hypothetical protein
MHRSRRRRRVSGGTSAVAENHDFTAREIRRLTKRRRWNCYMGRFRVPDWLFNISPPWLHRFADKFGGVV